MASLADADDAALASLRTDLAAEYARIFLGMSRSPVAPYESVYTSETGLLMQEARDEVLAHYRREGFAVDEAVNLPEDHIAFEFGFMAGLARKTAAALDAGNAMRPSACSDVQAAFVADHLTPWVPALTDDVAAARSALLPRPGLAGPRFVAAEADVLATE